MKISKVFSLFLFGLLVSGIVQAQNAELEIQDISVEPVMAMDMDMDMDSMHKMAGDHEGCAFAKEGKGCSGDHAGCPMKKMMKGHHGGGSMMLMKLFCGVGMLVFLFLGAFVVRKGWTLAGRCCGESKSCKK